MYVNQLFPLVRSGTIKSASYVADAGLHGAIESILRIELGAEINANAWCIPQMFGWIQATARNSTTEILLNKFNLGIGLVAVVPKDSTDWKTIEGAIEIGKDHNVYVQLQVNSKHRKHRY